MNRDETVIQVTDGVGHLVAHALSLMPKRTHSLIASQLETAQVIITMDPATSSMSGVLRTTAGDVDLFLVGPNVS